MIETEREHIIEVLNNTISAIEEKDMGKLKAMSNQTIHSASIYQDKISINLAIGIYSLSKMLDRSKGKMSARKINTMLEKMISSIKKKKDTEFEKELEGSLKLINHLDKKFDIYVEDVLSQAKVRKGANIYRHGISLGQVAEILDVSLWDLMSYLGNAKFDEESSSKIKAIDRLKTAEEVFK